jgi:hypothetical protein
MGAYNVSGTLERFCSDLDPPCHPYLGVPEKHPEDYLFPADIEVGAQFAG